MKNIRIILCDDHNLVRTGFISLLKDEPGIFVVGEAENGNDLITRYHETTPDLIIADIAMPGLSGPDAFNKLKETVPGIKILFLSAYYSEQYIYMAYKTGAMGLLNKSISKGELLFAIKEISEGRKYFGAGYSDNSLNELMKKYEHKKKHVASGNISDFDDRILKLIAEGFTSKEISQKLFVSKHTIDAHRISIMHKNNLNSGNDLLRFAVLYTEGKKLLM